MPIPIISIAQMREWEQATWASGQTEAEVIRRVGKRIAEAALGLTHGGERLLLLAGKGHNGDDLRSAREHLNERRVDLLDVTDPAADFSKLEALLTLRPALIIDGLFGIGLNRPLSPDWVRFIEKVNAARLPVLAVDVPSGLNADTGEVEGTAIQATVTLTVGAPKTGMLREQAWPFVGRLEVAVEVGLLPCPLLSELQWTLPEDFNDYPPPRMAASHKGTYGHLVIVAGSVGYHGAAVLAARGAQRAQPGLITLYTAGAAYSPVASHLQAVMVSPWWTDPDLPHVSSAVLVGPGLASRDVPEDLKRWVRQMWRGSNLPMVVDASALNWLRSESVPRNSLRVVTPHPGEAARILGVAPKDVQANRLGTLRRLSENLGHAFVVLKGHQTLIGRAGASTFVNPSGNPYLAQGGSGDVLSGYIAGLLAQPTLQRDPLTLLRYAVWQHGFAADKLQAARNNWVVEDLVQELGASQK